MTVLPARPRGHQWPGRIDVLPRWEHELVLDHASDGAVLRYAPDSLDFSFTADRPDIREAIHEDELRAVLESV